jgi:hypothetical protein
MAMADGARTAVAAKETQRNENEKKVTRPRID